MMVETLMDMGSKTACSARFPPMLAARIAGSNSIANNPISWGSVGENDLGQAEVLGNLLSLVSSSAPGSPVTIFGYYITDGAYTKLLLAERFAVPFVLSRKFQPFALVPRLVEANN